MKAMDAKCILFRVTEHAAFSLWHFFQVVIAMIVYLSLRAARPRRHQDPMFAKIKRRHKFVITFTTTTLAVGFNGYSIILQRCKELLMKTITALKTTAPKRTTLCSDIQRAYHSQDYCQRFVCA